MLADPHTGFAPSGYRSPRRRPVDQTDARKSNGFGPDDCAVHRGGYPAGRSRGRRQRPVTVRIRTPLDQPCLAREHSHKRDGRGC